MLNYKLYQFIYVAALSSASVFIPSSAISLEKAVSDQKPISLRSMLIDFSQTCPARHAGLDLVSEERHATNKLCLYGTATKSKT